MFKSFGPAARGALFSLLAFTAWAFSDALTKGAGLGGVSPMMILLLSSLSTVLTVLLGIALRGGVARLRVHNKKGSAFRAFSVSIMTFLSVIAFTNLPLTTVYIGVFASPFLISIYGALFMGEKLSFKQGAAIAIGFLGVALALFPGTGNASSGLGNATLGYIALPFFLLTFVFNSVHLRVLGRTETPESMTFYPFLIRGCFLLPLLFFESIQEIPGPLFWAAFGSGFFCGIGFLLISAAYKLAPMAIVSSFHYTQLLTGALLGYLFWDAVPSVWVWGGGALIVASGFVMAHEARRMHREQKILIEES